MARRTLLRHRQATSTRIVATGLLALALVLTVVSCGGDDSQSSGGELFVQEEGEILLEPSGVAGPDSFAGEKFVAAGPTTTFSLPTGSTIPGTPERPAATTPGGGVEVPSYPGDTPALYGGSRSKARCDKEAQLVFLEQNPDKATAFCEALNSDPTLRWDGGNQLRPDQLRDYFAELTPMILTHDTRVTNHGYRDGHPTPRQSVLQAGQAVLVDRYGVIRVRCECGNPLLPPRPVKKTPAYTGPRWEGFDPTQIIVVQQTTVIINVFVIIDVETGEVFERPPGTTGDEDAPHEEETSTTTSLTPTSSASTSSSTASSSTTSSSTTTTLATTTTSSTTTTTSSTTTSSPGPALELDWADNGNGYAVEVRDIIEVRLPGNASTGYEWIVFLGKDDAALIRQVGEPDYVVDPRPSGMVGVGGTFIFTFEAVARGGALLKLVYARPSESERPLQTFAVTLKIR